MFSTMRRKNQQRVRESLRDVGEFRSDQGEVWESISEMSLRMNVASPTDAMADVFDRNEERLGEYLASFQLVACQVGAIFAIDGKLLGIECFGFHDTFRRYYDKLLQSDAWTPWAAQPKQRSARWNRPGRNDFWPPPPAAAGRRIPRWASATISGLNPGRCPELPW